MQQNINWFKCNKYLNVQSPTIKKKVDYETKLSNSLAHLIDKGGGRGGGLIPSGRN